MPSPNQATISNTPRNPILGLLADAIQPLQNLGNKVNVPLIGPLGDFMLEGTQSLLDDASYQGAQALGKGKGLQFKLDPRVLDVASIAYPMLKASPKVAGAAAKEVARQYHTGTGIGRYMASPKAEMIAYRGISQPYNPELKGSVEWFSESPDLANVYAGLGEGSNVIKKDLGNIEKNSADLRFRNSDADVTFDEMRKRVISSITDKVKNNQLSNKKAIEIISELKGYKPESDLKKVHQWWQQDGIIAKSLKDAGYDAIKDNERGFNTYGLLL